MYKRNLVEQDTKMVPDSKLNVHRLRADKKELIDLKLQIALQQEQLDLANQELNQALVEVAALQAEKSTLIDEFTTTKQEGGEQTRILEDLCRSF